jgi:hypothetical protein
MLSNIGQSINRMKFAMTTKITPTPRAPMLAAFTLACLSAMASCAQAQEISQQCATTRTASTYLATSTKALPVGSLLSPLKLTPCATYTGHGTAEISLVVDSQGHIVMAPVYSDQGPAALRSADDGVTWDEVVPLRADGTPHARLQPFMTIDGKTDRIFFHTARSSFAPAAVVPGFDLSYSDDGGANWTPSVIDVPGYDWGKLIPGPPVGGARSSGYPNNLYLSAPTPISTPAVIVNPVSQVIVKSTDGGQTWAKAGSYPISAKANGCPASEYVLWGDGAVAPDGTIYIGGRRCTHFGIAMSKDEGKTWTVKDVPGSKLIVFKSTLDVPYNPNYIMPSPLTIDKDGNIYAVWTDEVNLLRLSVSKDKGKTWSTPRVISDPKINTVIYPAVAVKKPGTIAIAYYGSSDKGKVFNGYMAESVNALSSTPVFKSQVVNDPAVPTHAQGFDVGYGGMFSGGDLNEIVQIRYAPNGDLLTAFTQDMCPGNTCDASWDKAAHANSRWQAVLGRLIHK